jgi:hypothetical protein
MSHDEWVDLDVTGDPGLDQQGYQSPSEPRAMQRHQAEAKRRREERREITQFERDATLARNLKETRLRREQKRRGGAAPPPQPEPQQQPEPVAPPQQDRPVAYLTGDQLPAQQALDIMRTAPGHEPGWHRVDLSPDGWVTWTKVDQPGEGPRVTAYGEPRTAPYIVPFPPGSGYQPGIGPIRRPKEPREPREPRRRWWQWWRRPGPDDPETSPGTVLY